MYVYTCIYIGSDVVAMVVEHLRSIQKTSKVSYTLSLPVEWVRLHGLKEKSRVVVADMGNVLMIKPPLERMKKTVWDFKNLNSVLLKQYVVASYIKHHDVIEIKNLPTSEYMMLKEFGDNSIIGFRSTYNYSTHTATITFEVSETYYDRERILSHVFNLAEGFIIYAEKNIKKRRKKMEEMYVMDAEIDKYYYLSHRLFPYDHVSMYTTIIENFADSLIAISELKIISMHEIKRVVHIFDRMRIRYNDIIEGYYYRDAKRLSEISTEIREDIKRIKKRKLSFINEPLRLLKDLCECMIDELIPS